MSHKEGFIVLYYSKKTKKLYETVEELETAEKAYDEEHAEAEKKVAEKKDRAKAIEDAYKHAQEVRKAAAEMIKEADKKYYDLRNAFIKDYGSFPMSYSEKVDDAEDAAISALSRVLSGWLW